MMYQIRFTHDAEADLSRLTKTIIQRIFKKLRWLAENFNIIIPKPLTGQLQDMFKLRVGDYRVLYTFDKTESNITIHAVGHRREVYKIR